MKRNIFHQKKLFIKIAHLFSTVLFVLLIQTNNHCYSQECGINANTESAGGLIVGNYCEGLSYYHSTPSSQPTTYLSPLVNINFDANGNPTSATKLVDTYDGVLPRVIPININIVSFTGTYNGVSYLDVGNPTLPDGSIRVDGNNSLNPENVLDKLNSAFNGTYGGGNGIDSNIRFELVTCRPSGQNGTINYINSNYALGKNVPSNYDPVIPAPYDIPQYNSQTDTFEPSGFNAYDQAGSELTEESFLMQVVYPNLLDGCINVFYCPNIAFGGAGIATHNYVNIITDFVPGIGGNGLYNLDLDKTFIHEIGHTLGLRHTFQCTAGSQNSQNICEGTINNQAYQYNAISAQNCFLQGDWVCDTPPHLSNEPTNSNGHLINYQACGYPTGTSYSDPIAYNFMSYYTTLNQNRFTQGQINRMNTYLTLGLDRPSLGPNLGAFSENFLENSPPQYGPDYYAKSHLYSGQNQLETGVIGASPSKSIDKIIVIQSGTDVTIDCDRYFGPNGGILVENGARLTIDGATLTTAQNITTASGRWKGITVLGCDNIADQPNASTILNGNVTTTTQGVAIFKNGATIENAEIGVINPPAFNATYLTNDPNLTTKYNGNTDTRGGIIISDGTSSQVLFSDNVNDIVFNSSRNQTVAPQIGSHLYTSSSMIKNTKFETSNNTYYPNNAVDITINNIDGITITDSEFVSNVDLSVRLVGVVLSYAHADIQESNFTGYTEGVFFSCSRGNVLNCNFEDNMQGIFSYSWVIAFPTSFFNGNYFKGNGAGIYSMDYEIDITSNYFEILPNSKVMDHNGYQYTCGVFSDYVANISGNYFYGNDGSNSISSFGIIENGIGGSSVISDNDFKSTDVGISCQGNNALLTVKCNQFGSDGVPHSVTAWRVSSGEVGAQGTCTTNAADDKPVSNHWMYTNCPSNNTNTDFWIDYSNDPNIPQLQYRTYSTPVGSGYKLLPTCVDQAHINAQGCTAQPESTLGTCTLYEGLDDDDDDIVTGCGQADQIIFTTFINRLDELDAEIESIRNLLDDGSTSQLITDINDPAISQSELTNQLSEVEHLSQEVQVQAIDRFDPLSSNKLGEVLISQAPYEKKVIDELNTRVQPVATSVYNQLMDAHNQERLQHNLTSAHLERKTILDDIIKYEDDLILCFYRSGNEDEMIRVMNESRFPETKVRLIDHYLQKNNLNDALEVLNETDGFSDHYVDYTTIMIQLKMDNRNIEELTDNELSIIQTIANEGKPNEKPVIESKILLDRIGLDNFTPYVDPLGQTAGKRPFVPDEDNFTKFVKVSPNPANIFIGIQTNFENDAKLSVYDTDGKLLTELHIKGGDVVNEIEVEKWHNGVYYYQISNNLQLLQAGKFIVQH